MKVRKTPLQGLIVLESTVHHDQRGFFLEVFRSQVLRDQGVEEEFVQANRSFSRANVLRGLHFQNPSPQGKLVTVAHGAVFDVAVDIRPGSKTFGQWYGETLTGDNGLHLWVPVGFAHGFVALKDAVLGYQVTDYYDREGDSAIFWNDPAIGIEWPVREPIVSEKDTVAPLLADLAPKKLNW